MADDAKKSETADAAATDDAESLEGGTYQVIRNRLTNLNKDLRAKLEKLNDLRRDVFGGMEIQVVGNERIVTDNNCVPRDIVNLGESVIFGYNVFIGMKKETDLADVFSLYTFTDGQFHKGDVGAFLESGSFKRDFSELYRYYKSARFLQFVRLEGVLLMVFQAGQSVSDVKVFRWDIKKDGSFVYADDRAEDRYAFPAQHEFKWTLTTRDDQIAGPHPHVSVLDKVFVECVGGDLTIKLENNTASGEGIYAEPVENSDQTLDDAAIHYAQLGDLILLKVLPYRETQHRYFVCNLKTQSAARVDSMAQACILLPENHGLIFPRGYYLPDGTLREFDEDVAGIKYQRLIRSPNGEDYLYVFYHPEQGRYILLLYNLISKSVENPITCHGFTIFGDGKMAMFNNPDDEPRKAHAMQVWQTPFYSDTFEVPQRTDSFLNKIGNRDLVRGISDCYSISRMVAQDTVTVTLYNDMLRECQNTLDGYYWLDHDECFKLKDVILQVKTGAIAAVDEYDKVVRVRLETEKALASAEAKVKAAVDASKYGRRDVIDDYVNVLNDMRRLRGNVISLKELRYTQVPRIDAMEGALEKAMEATSLACVEFLLDPKSLKPYLSRIVELDAKIEGIDKVADLKPVEEGLGELAERLDLLTDVVNNLQIEDSTKTTAIVDAITEVYGSLNRSKAMARNLKLDLSRGEAQGEFAAQFKLLSQSITNYIGMCDTPEKCDEFLTKIMITVEELEGRFSDFEEFIGQLGEKRDEAYSAFSNRKQVLDEEKKRRIGNLLSSANRILKGIRNRAESFKELDEVNAYFASDLMVSKLRDTIAKLQELGDSVKADDLLGQLKSTRDNTVRKLRDKLDIYEDGGDTIKFGDYKFSVNTQPLELTTVLREDDMYFHLTGTDYYELITDPEFLQTKHLWSQEIVSETPEVYRVEYLAYQILMAATQNERGLSLALLTAAAQKPEITDLEKIVRDFASTLYTEGYDKGIHDHDAARVLKRLVVLYQEVALLRYDSTSRAHAIIFWCYYPDQALKDRLRSKMRSYGQISAVLGHSEAKQEYVVEIYEYMVAFFEPLVSTLDHSVLRHAAEFLFHELQDEEELLFTINALAQDLHDRFMKSMAERKADAAFMSAVTSLDADLKAKLNLIFDWVRTYVRQFEEEEARHLIWEVIALIAARDVINTETQALSTYVKVTGLLGQHALVEDKSLEIYFDRFLLKMNHFVNERVPAFLGYQEQRLRLTVAARDEMRLSEFESKVMGSFVRNRLINNVYLNLVGANFAKQLGAAGEAKRTDLMGLLLLISPPGYGKTTLMEYISNRLGLTFMKINGPAIGHNVTSLDPAEAPNATAREEVDKLNLAFEMGNNVMIYLDDIQHLNPELLQKFISLCDGQRKIEGVYKGVTKTYDLRGKKVAVVMAGNPYTESGAAFKIPDMLANRADTYNLGDISSTNADDFALSFIENSMTSNPVLAKISTHSHDDLYKFVQILDTGSQEGIQFDYHYPAADVNEILNILGKCRMIQRTVLTVNEEYIRSAAQDDAYRVAPPFKLQGSYRNMSRMVEKIYAVMTDEEVDQVIVDHYNNEAQTLTTGAEANLLKFKELTNRMTPDEIERWAGIKKEFGRRQMFAGSDGDSMDKILAMMATFNVNLGDITGVLKSGLGPGLQQALAAAQPPPTDLRPVVASVDQLAAALAAGRASQSAAAIDLTPVVQALAGLGDSLATPPQAPQAPQQTVDLTPIVEVLQAMQTQAPRSKDMTKAWDRQITAIECMLPILQAIKEQSDTFLKLKTLLEDVIDAKARKTD